MHILCYNDINNISKYKKDITNILDIGIYA